MTIGKHRFLPSETRANFFKAVKQGVLLAEQRQLGTECFNRTRAAEIIATIPMLVLEETKAGLLGNADRFRAHLMPIDAGDTCKPLNTKCLWSNSFDKTSIKKSSLVGAAKIVCDHCLEAGLAVAFSLNKELGQPFATYSLDITWSINNVGALVISTKPKRWWQLF